MASKGLKLRDVIPDFYSGRIKKVATKIKKDKAKINTIVEKHNTEFKDDILEGTKKVQKLLREGHFADTEEAHSHIITESGFIPTIYTPVLNWLFHFMEQKEFGKEESRMQLNENIGHLTHEEVEVMQNTPELFEYLYGNITLDIFSKLKKLKALSKSSNENEAFSAYRKCLTLCEQNNIDFDKIPIS